MKKKLSLILLILLSLPIVGIFKEEEVSADEYYAYACSYDDYEVAYINDDGSFTSKACYSDFDSAKAKMQELGDDYVVRHATSLSPTKIVAMNSGVVYSYPGRSGTNTLKIYQDASIRNQYYKQTYVSNHYEMTYIATERYLPNYNGGIVQVEINGFIGYADLEYTDLVPTKYLEKGIGLYLGGNNTYDGEEAFYLIPVANYYSIEKNGNYNDLVFHYSRAYPENDHKAIVYTINIGQAPSFMKKGKKYYSSDGINFYSDMKHNSLVGTYYNYYQYLPLRSKSTISAAILESFLAENSKNSVMSGHGSDFINAQNEYGVNSLLLFAMACHESAYGTSNYAKVRNNLFGWNAFDASPSSASNFTSITSCINEQAGINLRGYLDITDGRFFSSSLGNKGSGLNVKYASDPYWGMKIAAIAYKIDKYANNNDGNYSDLDTYTLASINTFDVEIKTEASDNSKTLYTTQYGPYYQKDFIVIVLDKGETYTKIQSTNAIDADGNIKTHRTPITTGEINPISTYDYDLSVAYLPNKYLSYLNQDETNYNENISFNLMSAVDQLEFNNDELLISGCAFIKGLNHNDLSNISHRLILRNITDNTIYKSYSATTVQYSGIKFNDGKDYTYVGFELTLPLNELSTGNYYLCIEVNNGNYQYESKLLNYLDEYYLQSYRLKDISYQLITNNIYGKRLELNVESLPEVIAYQNINKPSTRDSLFSFDEFTLDETGNLTISGQGMIYYCDYDEPKQISYTLYLVDDAENYLEIACDTIKSSLNYQQMLNSSYNMDYICFEADTNISNLKEGTYKMLLKIVNGTYVDYLELTNPAHLDVPNTVIGDSDFRFFTSSIRDRLMLEVK